MALSGYIDFLSHERLAGWACESDLPDTPVSLVIAVGGRVVARCLADQYRADLVEVGIGSGASGFDFLLPTPLSKFDAHEISIRREGDGMHLPESPRTLSCTTLLDAPTKLAIELLVASLDRETADEALLFFSLQTERIRDLVAEIQSGAFDRRRRKGLGWAKRTVSFPNELAPVISVPRALIVDDSIPSYGRDAGSDAILSHMQSLRRLGYDVTFVPATLNGDPSALDAMGIAVCLHPWYASVEDLLRRQANSFELVYLHRIANAAAYLGLVRQYQPAAKAVYSVADLHFLRSLRQAQIEARPELAVLSARQRVTEFAAALQSDSVITHSSYEAGLLRNQLAPTKVHVVPWAIPLRPVSEPFSTRRGAAFIANYQHQPNADAARLLLERIMPEVWIRDSSFPCLLGGSGMPQWLQSLTQKPAEALGSVPDLAQLFGRVRLSVAPLSFGAGIKGKVMMSLAAGIPCVCTSIAAEGLDLPEPLTELIADEPSQFAAIMLRLEHDPDFNASCASIGLDYVAARLSEDVIDRLMREAIRRF